jgi:hypothetical protein
VVKTHERHILKPKESKKASNGVSNPSWVRASISFPAGLHETLQDLAKRKKVSLAWVVRDAVERYVNLEAKELRG